MTEYDIRIVSKVSELFMGINEKAQCIIRIDLLSEFSYLIRSVTNADIV